MWSALQFVIFIVEPKRLYITFMNKNIILTQAKSEPGAGTHTIFKNQSQSRAVSGDETNATQKNKNIIKICLEHALQYSSCCYIVISMQQLCMQAVYSTVNVCNQQIMPVFKRFSNYIGSKFTAIFAISLRYRRVRESKNEKK